MQKRTRIRFVRALCVGLLVALGGRGMAYAQCPPETAAPPKVETVEEKPCGDDVTPLEGRIARIEVLVRGLTARCDDFPHLVGALLQPLQLPMLGKRLQDLETVTLDLQAKFAMISTRVEHLAGVPQAVAQLQVAVGGILESMGKTCRDLEALQDSVSLLRDVPATIIRLDSAVAGVSARLTKLEGEITLRFDDVQKALARLNTMSERLETADQTARAALAGVAQNTDRLAALEGAVQRLRREMDPVPVEIGKLNLAVRSIESDISELQELTRALMNRVIELEKRQCGTQEIPIWAILIGVGAIAALVLMSQ